MRDVFVIWVIDLTILGISLSFGETSNVAAKERIGIFSPVTLRLKIRTAGITRRQELKKLSSQNELERFILNSIKFKCG